MSLKKTARAASIKPKPRLKTYTQIIRSGKNKTFIVGVILKNSMTAITAKNENPKFTKAKVTFSRGKIHLLILIFLIKGAACTIDDIDVDVASLINVKSVCPKIR